MGYWIGRRVEIPAYFDAWMRGARYGVVVSVAPNGLARVHLDKGGYVRVFTDDFAWVDEVVPA